MQADSFSFFASRVLESCSSCVRRSWEERATSASETVKIAVTPCQYTLLPAASRYAEDDERLANAQVLQERQKLESQHGPQVSSQKQCVPFRLFRTFS